MSYNSTNKVLYPSSIFRLEKHEIFPFERFAYCAMKIGADVLPPANLPNSIEISFDDSNSIFKYPWLVNAGIMQNIYGDGFKIITTSLTPVIIMAICHSIGLYLFNSDHDLDKFEFRKKVTDLGNNLNSLINSYNNDGLQKSIRSLFDDIGLGIFNFSAPVLFFDLTTQFIVNHEIAHAYAGQLTSKHNYSEGENRAFEFIVDLVATEWLYNKMIRNTPDTEEYRNLRGVKNYSESIIENTMTTLDMQINTVLVFAFAGAIVNGGHFSLEGGISHPHPLSRYGLQMMHLTTLVLSNYKDIFSKEVETELGDRWTYYFSFLIESGLISQNDIKAMASGTFYADLKDAIGLINTHNILELKKVVPFLELILNENANVNLMHIMLPKFRTVK